jgi:iron complex transport system ATP-binding protein
MFMSFSSGLRVRDLSLQVAGRSILHAIDFDLPAGQVLGLLGPNGAGKTSLLRALSAQIMPAQMNGRGEVFWQQRRVRDYGLSERARRIAVVNQLNDPVLALTLWQLVQMGLLPHQTLLSRQSVADHVRIEQALQRVGLLDKAEQRFSTLSGGEQQRALIARALVQQAALIILDEPVNHLDVYYQHDVLGLLRQLCHETGLTVVMSLHDLNLAAMYCDALALLHNGELCAFGSALSVLQPGLLEQVFRLPCAVRSQDGLIRVDFCPGLMPVSKPVLAAPLTDSQNANLQVSG